MNMFIIFYYTTHVPLTTLCLIQQTLMFSLVSMLKFYYVGKNNDINRFQLTYITITPGLLFILFQCIRKSKQAPFNQLFSQNQTSQQIKESFLKIKQQAESQLQQFKLKFNHYQLSSTGIIVCFKIQTLLPEIQKVNAAFCYIERMVQDQNGTIIEISSKKVIAFFECIQMQQIISIKLNQIVNISTFIINYLKKLDTDIGIGISYGTIQHRIARFGKLTKIIRSGVQIDNALKIATSIINEIGINIKSFKKDHDQSLDEFHSVKLSQDQNINNQQIVKPNFEFKYNKITEIVFIALKGQITFKIDKIMVSGSQQIINSRNSSNDSCNNLVAISKSMRLKTRLIYDLDEFNLNSKRKINLPLHSVKQDRNIPIIPPICHSNTQLNEKLILPFNNQDSETSEENFVTESNNINSLSTVTEVENLSNIVGQKKVIAQQNQYVKLNNTQLIIITLAKHYFEFFKKIFFKYMDLMTLQKISPMVKYLMMDNKIQLYGCVIVIIMISSTLFKYRTQISFTNQNILYQINVVQYKWNHIELYEMYARFVIIINVLQIILSLASFQLYIMFQKKLHTNTAYKNIVQLHSLHRNMHHAQLIVFLTYLIVQIVLFDGFLQLLKIAQQHTELQHVTLFLLSHILLFMMLNCQFIQTMYISPEYVPMHYKIFLVYNIYFIIIMWQQSPIMAINYIYHNIHFQEHSFYNLMIQLTNFKKMFKTKCILDTVVDELLQYQSGVSVKGYFLKNISQFEYLQYNLLKNLDIETKNVDTINIQQIQLARKHDITYINSLNRDLQPKVSKYFVLHAKHSILIRIDYQCAPNELTQFLNEVFVVQNCYPKILHFLNLSNNRIMLIAHSNSGNNIQKQYKLMKTALDFCFLVKKIQGTLNRFKSPGQSENVTEFDQTIMQTVHQHLESLLSTQGSASGEPEWQGCSFSIDGSEQGASVKVEQLRSILASSSGTSKLLTGQNSQAILRHDSAQILNASNVSNQSEIPLFIQKVENNVKFRFSLSVGDLQCGALGDQGNCFGAFGPPALKLEQLPTERKLDGSIASTVHFLRLFRELAQKAGMTCRYSIELTHNGLLASYTQRDVSEDQ